MPRRSAVTFANPACVTSPPPRPIPHKAICSGWPPILFGADALIKRWKVFFAAGLLTMAAAAVLLADLAGGAAIVTNWVLGLFLLMQGLAKVAIGASHTGSRRGLEMLRGAAMVVVVSLVLDFPWENALTAGVLFTAAFFFNGVLRIACSLLVMYPRWRWTTPVPCVALHIPGTT